VSPRAVSNKVATTKPATTRVAKTKAATVDSVFAKVGLGKSHVFLTGGTGFLGQAVLERLLSDHPETTVTLLIRKKGSTPAVDRLRTLLKKPVFRVWRERVGEAAVETALTTRLRVVESGLGPLPPLPKDLDVVIHSASTVSFDPPIDQAFDTNVGGAVGLYEALLASGSDPQVVHVSTCYVGGIRKGVAPEDQVRIFEKFERVDPSEAGGNGLGLFIARRLARAMQGDLTIESAPGEGARFILKLPADPARR